MLTNFIWNPGESWGIQASGEGSAERGVPVGHILSSPVGGGGNLTLPPGQPGSLQHKAYVTLLTSVLE